MFDVDCWTILGLVWVVSLWDFYLSIRQYRVHRDTATRPENVKAIISEEDYAKARLYAIDKHHFNFVRSIYGLLQLTALVVFELFVILWTLCGSINERIGVSSQMRTDEKCFQMAQSVAFICLTTLIETVLSFPWQIYETFVIEQKHGFNKQTFAFFLKDKIKKTIVGLMLCVPITTIVIYIVENGGKYFFFYVWIFLSIVLFLLMTIYPEFIAPLFDKYTPLPESALREKIEKLADYCHFPLKKLYVVHGSKRSAHSNAYMYGIWNNKRIVLYDTLLSEEMNAKLNEAEKKVDDDGKQGDESKDEENKNEEGSKIEKKNVGLEDDEVVAVLGHELGHWHFLHNAVNIFITEANLLGMLAVFHLCYQNSHLYNAFGFYDSKPTIIGFIIVFQYIMAPYDELISFLMTMLSRRMEFSADQFSLSLGHGKQLCAALIKLGKNNLSLPVDDWLYSTFNHSHPSIPERIEAIERKQKSD
ncbi:unnamed protein product [Anisakis simplex]|uniref:CAAX prenyl protease n=1 Tax=Anisakis simplex TaxID=6269 RepID=A0A0M3JTN1_ANISI|nr:unnamed protein product [Anisakis simplex]